MTCSECNLPGNEELRELLGCVEPAAEAVADILCSRCDGTDVARCEVCDGEGREMIYRCPRALVEREYVELLPYLLFANEGQWPVAGGMLEQSPQFIRAVMEYRRELAEWQENQERKRRARMR